MRLLKACQVTSRGDLAEHLQLSPSTLVAGRSNPPPPIVCTNPEFGERTQDRTRSAKDATGRALPSP